MGIIRNIRRNPKGPLIRNLNTIIESLFVIMTFLPIAGIGYGLYILILTYNKL